jgi:hypothetical protein
MLDRERFSDSLRGRLIERFSAMRLNVSITHASEQEVIAMLTAFAERVARDRKLPPMEVLSDSTSVVSGSVYTTDKAAGGAAPRTGK